MSPACASALCIQAWLAANPKAPMYLRKSAARLLGYDEAPELWARFDPAGGQAMAVLTAAAQALLSAEQELARDTAHPEAKSFDAVRRKIAELRDAIEQAPLPRASLSAHTLRTAGEEDVMLWLGWVRDELPQGMPGHAVSVLQVLQTAEAMLCQDAALPPRALKRRRPPPDDPRRPLVRAFVIWCDWNLRRRFDAADSLAVAHLANALLGLVVPLDAAAVTEALKHRTAEFAKR